MSDSLDKRMIKSLLLKIYKITSWPIGFIIRAFKLDKAVAAGVQFMIGLYIQRKMAKMMEGMIDDK